MNDDGSKVDISDLEDYLRNAFLPRALEDLPETPLKDESHVASWRQWLMDGDVTPARLAQQLPHLMFGVREGLSRDDGYRRAILSADMSALPPDQFDPVGRIDVTLEKHWAGHLPVIQITERDDFEYLYAALAHRGEPITISPQVHAAMIAGLVSPVRLAEGRRAWEEGVLQADPLVAGCSNWPEAMNALDKSDRTRFRERILLMHEAEYACLAAEDVASGLDQSEWLKMSRVIRLEHEFTHYATTRVFGSMRLNLHDEVLADCMGFLAAFKRFDSNLFLRGLGIDESLQPMPGGRVWMYVPGLKEDEIPEVCALAASAARNVEAAVAETGDLRSPALLHRLASVALKEMAGESGAERLESILRS